MASPECPYCKSMNVKHDSFRVLKSGLKVERLRCVDCHKRFTLGAPHRRMKLIHDAIGNMATIKKVEDRIIIVR